MNWNTLHRSFLQNISVMNKSNHPDLIRLEQILEDNPTWAVKITDVDRNNDPQRLPLNGKNILWIHHKHLSYGLQHHVEELAKKRNIKKMGFEIKRKNGSGYIRPGKNSLSNPYFSIPFTSLNHNSVNSISNDTAFAKAEQPKIEASVMSGLSGAQMMEFLGNSIHKGYIERDLAKIEAENNVLRPENERLREELRELKNEKLIEQKPKAVDKIFQAVQDNPAILRELFGGLSMLVPKEKSTGGLSGVKSLESSRSPQKINLINHIDENDDKKAQQLGDVALFMDNDPEFATELTGSIKKAYDKLLKPA